MQLIWNRYNNTTEIEETFIIIYQWYGYYYPATLEDPEGFPELEYTFLGDAPLFCDKEHKIIEQACIDKKEFLNTVI